MNERSLSSNVLHVKNGKSPTRRWNPVTGRKILASPEASSRGGFERAGVSSDAYMHRYHVVLRPSLCLLTPRPAACRWALVLSVRAPPCQKAHARGRARRPAAPTAPCALTSRSGRPRSRAPACILLWRPRPGPSNALPEMQNAARPFLAHADGRRRQHRRQTHSAMLYRHFAPDLY